MLNNNLLQFLLQAKQCGSPKQFAMNMMKQNPQMQNLINMGQNSGLSPQQFLNQFCKQRGMNVDDIYSTLNQLGIKF